MLKGSTRILFSRILGVNKFHKTPVIMTKSQKDELLPRLDNHLMRSLHNYSIKVGCIDSSLSDDSSIKWEFYLRPDKYSMSGVDKIIRVAEGISPCITFYIPLDRGGCLNII